MEKYNCLIVEDEPLAAEVLRDYIKEIPFLELCGICTDAINAMEVLQKKKIDLVFLDIHLPKLKGLDFIRTLKNPPHIIVTTAYRDYAIESFELNVLDYLVKPVNFNRFLSAVNKIKGPHQLISKSQGPLPLAEPDHIFINVNKKMVKLWLEEILYIESKKDYISIVTKNKTWLTKMQLGEIENELAGKFLRVHRSFLVAKRKIDAFTATEVEIAGHQIPIGRSYKESVNELLEAKRD